MGSEANVESQTASGQCVREMYHLQQEAWCAALSKTVPHEKLHVASSLLSKETIYRGVTIFHTGHIYILRVIEQSCLKVTTWWLKHVAVLFFY